MEQWPPYMCDEIRPGIDLNFLTSAELKMLIKILKRQKQHPNSVIAERSKKALILVENELETR